MIKGVVPSSKMVYYLSCCVYRRLPHPFLFRNAYFLKLVHLKIRLNEIPLRPSFLHTLFLHSFSLKVTALFLFHHHILHPSLSIPLFPLIMAPSHFPPSSVGRLLIEFSSQMTMERVQKENPNVTEGGRYTPPDCRPRWKVCVHM